MPTPTYDLIASFTATSTVSSVTFSSIPDTYRDLVLIIEGAGTGGQNPHLRFNGDSGPNYNVVTMEGNGTSVSTVENASGDRAYLSFAYSAWNTSRANIIIQIFDYSQAKHKTLISRNSNASGGIGAIVNRWASTSTINSILATLALISGSKVHLYGIVS